MSAQDKGDEAAYPAKAIPKWLANMIGQYGVAGGREPNMESAGLWQTLIKGIQRHVREQIDADRAQRSASLTEPNELRMALSRFEDVVTRHACGDRSKAAVNDMRDDIIARWG